MNASVLHTMQHGLDESRGSIAMADDLNVIHTVRLDVEAFTKIPVKTGRERPDLI